MTEIEAVAIAGRKADELNLPWSSSCVVAKRHRIWPFPAFWRVVAKVHEEGSITTMQVSEKSRQAVPIRVLCPAGGLSKDV